jgi:hypothetical protein
MGLGLGLGLSFHHVWGSRIGINKPQHMRRALCDDERGFDNHGARPRIRHKTDLRGAGHG